MSEREYEYYEIIAAEICSIEVGKLWNNTRKREIVIARQFCMKYMKEKLNFSYSVSGERYNKDHATAMHAQKVINNYILTKDIWGDRYQLFFTRCIEYLDTNGIIEDDVNNKILNHGWKNYISESKELLSQLFKLIRNDAMEDYIRIYIKICTSRLGEIEYLYKIKDEERDL